MKRIIFECGTVTPMFLAADTNKPVRMPLETGVLSPTITLGLSKKLG